MQKNIQLSWPKFFLWLLISFVLGVVLGRVLSSNADVPFGKWNPLWTSGISSLQINHVSTHDQIQTIWIREDRQEIFTTVYGTVGRTVMSKMNIDCANSTVTMFEQRGFDDQLNLIQSNMVPRVATPPLDMSTIVPLVLMCGDVKTENLSLPKMSAPAPKEFSA